jgi:Bifunctional DNA primase/polymerase, N-terminal
VIPLEYTDAWLSRGARVVPLDGKNPGALLGRSWPQKATADPLVVASWRRRWPGANLGVLPGTAFLALDVDDPAALRARENELGPLPPTPTYLTGGAPGRRRLLICESPRAAATFGQ